MTTKTVFVIPGFRQKTTNRAYTKLAKILKAQGYSPILINLSWKNTSILKQTEKFLKEYKKIKTRRKYILGFSFGAMIAFIASTKVSPSGIILCSLSPFFKEDLSQKMLSKHSDFSKLNCKNLAKKIKAKKILMLYGTREERSLKKRTTTAFSLISSKRKYLIPIRKTEHDIGNINYLSTISQLTKSLSS